MIIDKAVEDLKRNDVICVGWSTKDQVTTWTRLEKVILVEPDPDKSGFISVCASQDGHPANYYSWEAKTMIGVSLEFTGRELSELAGLVHKKHESLRTDRRRKMALSVRAIWMTDLKKLLDKLDEAKIYVDEKERRRDVASDR